MMTSEKLKKRNEDLINLLHKIGDVSKELNETLKELDNIVRKNQPIVNRNIVDCLKKKKMDCHKTLDRLNVTWDEMEIMIENAVVVVPILVDDEEYGLGNGLVDLNRDVLIRLIGVVESEEKIRRVIGMGSLFFVWSKTRIFSLIRCQMIFNYPLKFLDCSKFPVSLAAPAKPSLLPMTEGKGVKTSFVGPDIRDGIHTIAVRRPSFFTCWSFGDVDVRHFLRVGVVISKLLNYIQTGNFHSLAYGTCDIDDNCITCGNQKVVAYNDSLRRTSTTELELNTHTHTLHFCVDRKWIPHCVVNVPAGVYFGFTHCTIGCTEVISRRKLVNPSRKPSIDCALYNWIYE